MPDEFDLSDLSYGDHIGSFKTPTGIRVNFSYTEPDDTFMLVDPRDAPTTTIVLSKKSQSPCILSGRTASRRSIFLYLSGDHRIEPDFGYLPIIAPFAIGAHQPGGFRIGVGNEDLLGTTFDAISFVGGNLELLVPEGGYRREEALMGSYEVNPEVEEYVTPPCIVEPDDDHIARFEVFRRTATRYAGETVAVFRLVFNERQPISRAFEYIAHMTRLVSFLSMSQKVAFLQIETELDIPSSFSEGLRDRIVVTNIACHQTREAIPDQREYRHRTHVLDITTIGPGIWSLFASARNNDLGGCGSNMSILPEDWAHAYHVSNTQIKNICTALEHEHAKLGLVTPKTAALAELKKVLHDCAKECLDNGAGEELSEQDRSRVFGSIGRIDVSASTQYQQLVDRHADAIEFPIDSFIRHHTDAKKRPNMQVLVKHRNEITHNAYLPLDEEVYISALQARLAVYASVLERCGFSEEQRRAAFARWF